MTIQKIEYIGRGINNSEQAREVLNNCSLDSDSLELLEMYLLLKAYFAINDFKVIDFE